MDAYKSNILVTGGAGFIGSHLVRHLVGLNSGNQIYNLDLLTYAGNLANLRDIESASNYTFIKGDICDTSLVQQILKKHEINVVIHLAAESHVDRSISNPTLFAETNVLGTLNLLNACLHHWNGDFRNKLFYHISTDEVFGSLGPEGFFNENTPYDPRSPYSASKASSDHFVRAYGETYQLPYIVSNCSNNYGPYQFPEKLIPLMINNCIHEQPLPVYGDGLQVRDWLYVEDHIDAIWTCLQKGTPGSTYLIGGNNEWKNIDLVHQLCDIMDEKLSRKKGHSASLISYVSDRAGHDKRYAIDASKIRKELGWKPKTNFQEGLRKTVDWYLDHPDWLTEVASGAYKTYYERHYKTV
ncbi:dTDP-glucose 4,6-dehydratase [Croceiramulus getboli]|nr:dTDP-glucose 4,6-dehydratase [Flavobacteriaceae bacterium YJPT1-3]